MRTRKLEAALQEEGVVESPEGYEKRNRVLANLNTFVKDWLFNYEIEVWPFQRRQSCTHTHVQNCSNKNNRLRAQDHVKMSARCTSQHRRVFDAPLLTTIDRSLSSEPCHRLLYAFHSWARAQRPRTSSRPRSLPLAPSDSASTRRVSPMQPTDPFPLSKTMRPGSLCLDEAMVAPPRIASLLTSVLACLSLLFWHAPPSFLDGDIDALICFPKSVTREAFFSSFYDALAKRDDVKELHVCVLARPAL